MKTPDQRAILGLPGDLAGGPSTHHETRVGGLPVFPGPVPPREPSQVICQVCDGPLVLVLQVYAPLEDTKCDSAKPQRALYIFTCLKEQCGSAFRAFRCQYTGAAEQPQRSEEPVSASGLHLSSQSPPLSGPNSSAAGPPEKHAQLPDNLAPLSASSQKSDEEGTEQQGWHVQSDWDREESGITQEKSASDIFDFSDLHEQLDSTFQQHRKHTGQARMKHQNQRTAQSDSVLHITSCTWPTGPSLPDFYLHLEAEPQVQSRHSDSSDMHIKQLVDRYKSEEAAGECAAAANLNPVLEQWTREAYEADTARGSDAVYLKFDRRLQRRPEQCMRYRYGGQPLWPALTPPPPPCCPECGAATACELQLMPALMSVLEEAHAWMLEADADSHLLLAPPRHWEWVTVVVWTCLQSCAQQGASSWVEQPVSVFQETY